LAGRNRIGAEITKYQAFYPESVYLGTVIKNLETAEPGRHSLPFEPGLGLVETGVEEEARALY
jgi:hypothetical protein